MSDKEKGIDKALLGFAAEVAESGGICSETGLLKDQDALGVVENLNSIARLAAAWGEQRRDHDGSEEEAEKVMFHWGHLAVLEQIGEGTFGEVYRAYDSVLDRDVALKLRKAGTGSAVFSRAFIEEARRLAKVRHTHVLAVHGASVHDQRVGMWADLITGDNLAERQVRYDSTEILEVARAMAGALDAVHSAGIIHGDVKPANMMVDAEQHLTLMDFGAGDEQPEGQAQSTSGSGTPALMAPELFADGCASTASDIYALGVSLFWLLTGSYRFEAGSIGEVQAIHQRGVYPKLATLRPDLPKSLVALVEEMMHSIADVRPSAGAVIQRLTWIAEAPRRRRRRALVATIIISLGIAALASGIGYLQATMARAEAVREQRTAAAINHFLQQMLNSASLQGSGKEARVVDILNYAAAEVDQALSTQQQVMANVRRSLGHAYMAVGQDQQAVDQFNAGLQLMKELPNQDHRSTAEAMIGLAKAQYRLGDYVGSQKSCGVVVDQALTHLSSVPPLVVAAKICIAKALTSQEAFPQAIELLTSLLRDFTDDESAGSDNRYQIFSGLAFAYRSAIDFENAEHYAREAVKWLELQPKSDPARRLAAEAELALILARQGKNAEAIDLIRGVAALNIRLFGEESAATMSTLMNLGGLLQESGRAMEALAVLERAERVALELLGPENERTVNVRINLANAKVSTGDEQGGRMLMEATLQTAYSQLGELSVATLMLEYNLAELQNKLGDYGAASKLSDLNHQKMEKKFGAGHPFELLAADNLAVSLSNLGQHDQALSRHQQVVAGLTAAVGSESPYLLLATEHYADTQARAGDLESASSTYRALIDQIKRVHGQGHPDAARVVEKLQNLTPVRRDPS